jgi:hypothetical protein
MKPPHNFTPENDSISAIIEEKIGRVARLLMNNKALASLQLDNLDALRAEAPKMEKQKLKQVANQYEKLLEKETKEAYLIMQDDDIYFSQFANLLQYCCSIIIKATVENRLTELLTVFTAWESGNIREEK